MASEKTTRSIVDTVSKRDQILSHVVDGIQDRREIVKKIDASRSTVYRALNEIEK